MGRLSLWSFCSMIACAAPAQSVVLESGGELDPATRPAETVLFEEGVLTAWGFTEIAGRPRLQPSLAMIDAVTRSELARYLEARVVAVMIDLEETERRAISDRVVTTLQAWLPSGVRIERGWRRVRRGEGEVLELIGRIRLDRERLTRAIEAQEIRAILERVFDESAR